MDTPSLPTGLEVIRRFCETLPGAPGVYRMLDAEGNALYIGKARSLKNRVPNYTNLAQLPHRLQRMVACTRSMEFTVTSSEAHALLLEANLIKTLNPRYNVLLKDDKSFPYIHISHGHPYPRISKYRGSRSIKGEFFGPFVSARAVDETLALLQRAFLLRPCVDTVFKNRSRPCLQYQIKRCSAPCVSNISVEDYSGLLSQARRFLNGERSEIQEDLLLQMQAASAGEDYETAAILRDRMKAMAAVQQQVRAHSVDTDTDFFALAREGGAVCVEIFTYRNGMQAGARAFFPQHTEDRGDDDVLSAVIGQYYQRHPPPKEIHVSLPLPEMPLLAEALGEIAGHKVALGVPQRGPKAAVMRQVGESAKASLTRKLHESMRDTGLREGVCKLFGLGGTPERIEIYDNSHVSGTNAVGAMVVAGQEGMDKKSYRIFNIKSETLTPGDDFGMMREVLTRRFKRLMSDEEASQGNRPDLVLIDGGAGQLSAAYAVMAEIGVADIPLVAISKGPDRNAGREWFHRVGHPPFQLEKNDPVLHYLQRLRDEAHRFAIGAHRGRRSRAAVRSELDTVANIGPARKKSLLLHFGSAKAVANASLEEIARAPGMSAALAQKVYDHFHGG